MFAEIIINSNARALNRIFDYIVPIEFENKIKIGSRVFVPFGNSKKLEEINESAQDQIDEKIIEAKLMEAKKANGNLAELNKKS